MAYKCDNCLKGIMMGHRVSHAKNRTNHMFKPNLQSKRIMVDGRMQRVRLCTSCIKLMQKNAREEKKILEELEAVTAAA
jgi:large subunit ribosomal protein L28